MKTMYKDLVFMANQIGDFYKNYPTNEEAIEGITSHLQKFWSPVMRQRIISYVEENGGIDLSPLVIEAIVKLKRCS